MISAYLDVRRADALKVRGYFKFDKLISTDYRTGSCIGLALLPKVRLDRIRQQLYD